MTNADTRPAAVGVDLGTSNSALAYYPAGADAKGSVPAILETLQLDGPGMAGKHRLLPSVLYVPYDGELQPREARLPWSPSGEDEIAADYVVGRWARDRAAGVPERAVVSAKSWLAHAGVDRRAPILPWKSAIPRGKRSPVEASRLYLEHLRQAFTQATGAMHADLVLTVPASFDEVARNLTHEAARGAGWANVTLLEEPLAALYAWIASSHESWRGALVPGDLILVCDVGGGTSDFSLVAATEEHGELKLERISVGDHLLLGGDNMDLALAYALKAKLGTAGAQIDHWQFLSLVAAARVAKERIFADGTLSEAPVAVAGRGSSLFAQTVSTSLTRVEAERLIVDGFFPLTRADEMPKARRALGIQEFGLSYEAEPAVSKHLARFLQKSRDNAAASPELRKLVEARLARGEGPLLPSAVLFNGGVFNARGLRERVLDLLKAWNGGEAVRELRHESSDFDLAVATGAAYYARMRQSGEGIRIRSGTAHSYYIGLESPMPAVPGYEPPVRGLCVVPQGTEEGTEIAFDAQEFGLIVGEPVEFRFFSSSARAGDAVGATVDDAAADLTETACLAMTLPPAEGHREGEMVPVRLEAAVTEVGTLQLYMKQVGGAGQKWQLELNVRASEGR